jgi:hypothetical protein
MAGESNDETKGLSEDELEASTGEALPDREAMSVVWLEPDPMPPEHTVEGEQQPLKGGEQQ